MSFENSLNCVEIDASSAHQASIIWLHGLGADGNDFVPVANELALSEMGVRFVFPHAPYRRITINAGAMMSGWYDIYALDGAEGEDAEGIADARVQLEDLIASEKARGIPADKIVLAGFSQGGAVVLYTGLRHDEKLAGIMALSTYLPLAPMTKDAQSDANKGVRVLMGHGTQDTVIMPKMAELSRDALRSLGCDVEWHEYPMAHGVCPDEINHIRSWLISVLDL